MTEYRLREDDLKSIAVLTRDNPHYKSAAPMRVYLHREIRQIARDKYGSDEEYKVSLIRIEDRLRECVFVDERSFDDFSPRQFQIFVAERLDAMGLEARLVGDIYRKDGGVDIVAYPKNSPAFPLLVAVQVKHHKDRRKSSVGSVRDLRGVLASPNLPFHAGMLVTNTTFTSDAKWFASHQASLLRLRDIEDLKRWLKGDFQNEADWREIPKEIELAPGILIKLPFC